MGVTPSPPRPPPPPPPPRGQLERGTVFRGSIRGGGGGRLSQTWAHNLANMKCQKYTYFILKRNETFLGNILFLENVVMGKSWRFKIMIFSLLECPSMLMSREKIAPLSSLSSLPPLLISPWAVYASISQKTLRGKKKEIWKDSEFWKGGGPLRMKEPGYIHSFLLLAHSDFRNNTYKKETFLYILLFHHHHLLLLFLPLSPPTP